MMRLPCTGRYRHSHWKRKRYCKRDRGIILVKDDVRDVVSGIRFSRATMKKVKQNLFWAFFYNAAGIPIAAGVLFLFTNQLLNPVYAAIAMALSSISVVANSLLMSFYKIES